MSVAANMDRSGMKSGHVPFDRRPGRTWDEKLSRREA